MKKNTSLCTILQIMLSIIAAISCRNPQFTPEEINTAADSPQITQNTQSQENTLSSQTKESTQNQQNTPNQQDPSNLGTLLFFGNSHTFRSDHIATLAEQNGYRLTAHHINTGGNVPLGIDKATHNTYESDRTLYADFKDSLIGNKPDHLSHFMKDGGKDVLRKGVSWVVLHDGSVYNSLTAAGAFMGLATALGAKTCCYQNWDTCPHSLYAARRLKLPLVPVGTAILKDNGYREKDGHMTNLGTYMFAVLFLHFMTNKPVDDIIGNAGFSELTAENKNLAKKHAKEALEETKKFVDEPYYFNELADFSRQNIDQAHTDIISATAYTRKMHLGEPIIIKMPVEIGKKLSVCVNSEDPSVVPDIWFYDANKNIVAAQGYNKDNSARYTYTGTGKAWESDGSCYLIVTRRGIPSKMSTYDNIENTHKDSDGVALFSKIDETEKIPEFSVTVTFCQ